MKICSAAGAWYSKTVVKNEKICQHANIYSNNKKIMIKTQKYNEIENGE